MVRSGKPPPVFIELLKNRTEEPWRDFNRCEQDTPASLSLFAGVTSSFPVCVCVCVSGVCTSSSRVYMADLESALHHSLRVELALQSVIKGNALTALKAYISVLAKVVTAHSTYDQRWQHSVQKYSIKNQCG